MPEISKYFDYAATTPVHPEVAAAMEPYFTECFGNPSSAHSWGQTGFAAVENARDGLSRHFNTDAENILFTGSSTESNNTVLNSFVMTYWHKFHKSCHLLISRMEHSAVHQTAEHLQNSGFCTINYLPIDQSGLVNPDDVCRMIRPDTVLVSVIYGNNEIGTINPIPEIGTICAEKGVPFHSDATQFAAHNLLDLQTININFISIAAHKCYGPKGIGALISRSGEKVFPLIYGGRQENSGRAGTHNVPYIVGIGKAYNLLGRDFGKRIPDELDLRNQLINRILSSVPDSVLTGHPSNRLSNHASFAFRDIDGLSLQSLLDQKGFAVSIGSACRSKSMKGQQQLRDIGLDDHWSNGGLRITVGCYSTGQAVDELTESLRNCIAFLRKTGL
ncbi:MAG: cysteine desulfurase family protein [Flexilinea sp.]